MSVEKVRGGYENVGATGSHGKFATKAGAERQKAAMFANGWSPGKADGGEISEDELRRQILQHLLKKEQAGSHQGLIDALRDKAEAVTEPDALDAAPVEDSSTDVDGTPTVNAAGEDEDEDEDEDTKNIVKALLAQRK